MRGPNDSDGGSFLLACEDFWEGSTSHSQLHFIEFIYFSPALSFIYLFIYYLSGDQLARANSIL